MAGILLSGCLAGTPNLDTANGEKVTALVDEMLPGFEQAHNHLDSALHSFGKDLDLLGYNSLVPPGDSTDASKRGDWLNSEIIVRGHYAYVGYLGAPWSFAVVDLADAAHPTIEGTYDLSGVWTMDMAVSDDGNWVFASLYNGAATGTTFDNAYITKHPDVPNGPAVNGVAVVDVRDKAHPALTGFLPIHGLGPHTAAYHRYPSGREVIFANKADAPGGNAVVIAEVVTLASGGKTLVPLTVWSLDTVGLKEFPHDVDVAEHPVTGRTLLYLAYWNAGLVIVDVNDPANPVLVKQGIQYPKDEEVQIHDTHPFPTLVGGHAYAFSAPEIPAGKTSGHLRIYDMTDPVQTRLVGTWKVPGDYVSDANFIFSTHNFQFLQDGRVALAHGHAGVWIVDWLGPGGAAHPDAAYLAAPHSAGFYVPHASGVRVPSWDPVQGSTWVWGTGVDERGHVWALDVAEGLFGFQPH